jgi:energy-coupling factor transporter ATP-binding protein EcfA2
MSATERTQPSGASGNMRAQLRGLRRELHRDVDGVRELRAVADRSDELDNLLGDLDRQLERAERAAVITLVGATGAGKSTLLNALAGSTIAVEGVDRPTTRHPVVYAPHDADVSELTTPEVERPQGHESEGGVQVVRYGTESGPWTAQILVDAPDMNSIDPQHRATVTALAERSDVLVVVLHRQSILEESSVSFVDDFAGRRQLLFVLNRADELTPESRDGLLRQVRSLAAERWNAPAAPVLTLSAREAQSQPNAPGWAEFCAALHGLVRESAIGGIRRLNAIGTAARIAAVFHEVTEAVRGDLQKLPEQARDGLDTLVERCADEVSTRLELRSADLRELLWAEAAKRWDGPGGWALRTGGLGSLGLGSAAALATRNPLLAAGAAAGALAADQVQKAVRDRRVTDVTGLMPAPSEFESWYKEGLSDARVSAARLVGSADGLGLPSVDTARADAGLAVEESWKTLLERDLPEAAERSVLRFFRLLLDLPVYGLAGWVLYNVATGFFAGDYVGFDFLVNAALILAAYLFAVRFAVRRGLALRARRLLQEVIQRTRQALGGRIEAVHRTLARVRAERLAALDRLCDVDERWRSELGGKK